jgi:protein-tyrosine phosphatase
MQFTDLLTHVLPAVDDGPETFDESVQMVQAAALEGASTLIATPHLRDVEHNSSADDVRERLGDLNSRLRREAAEGKPFARVLLGMENHVTHELPDQVDAGKALTLAGSRFILIATPFATFPGYIHDVLIRLRMKRLVPVLARPERNEVLRKDFGRMRELIQDGTLFVVTAGSITGVFGKGPQRAGLRMVQQKLAHAVVSDMHRMEGSRPPGLRRAYRWVERATDEATAVRVMQEQPQMVLRGHSPESERAKDDAESGAWWQALVPGVLRGSGRR